MENEFSNLLSENTQNIPPETPNYEVAYKLYTEDQKDSEPILNSKPNQMSSYSKSKKENYYQSNEENENTIDIVSTNEIGSLVV